MLLFVTAYYVTVFFDLFETVIWKLCTFIVFLYDKFMLFVQDTDYLEYSDSPELTAIILLDFHYIYSAFIFYRICLFII